MCVIFQQKKCEIQDSHDDLFAEIEAVILFNATFMVIRLILMISIIIQRAQRATVFKIFA